MAQWRRSQTSEMLWRSVWGWVQGGVGTFGGRGGGGAVTLEGARRRSESSDVCFVLRVERSSRRSSSRPALRNVYSDFNTVFVPLLLLAAGVGFPVACF